MKTGHKEIICNCCKKVVQKDGAVPNMEYLHIQKEWGYFSGKDGEIQEFDICESCYDAWVKGFQIPVESREVVELM
ncbi:hypothetical protein AALC25_20375 [Lachnospiraceae bacterium 29-84]